MNVFELFAKLGIDTSEYDKGLDESEKKGSSFGQKLGSVIGGGAKIAGAAIAATGAATIAGATAFVNGAKDVSAYGDNIDKMSQKLGFSSSAFQSWDFILQHNGSSIESVKGALIKLDKAVDSNSKAFKDLGLTQEQLQKMSPEEKWEAVVKSLQGVEDQTKKAELAQSVFGKSYQEFMPLLNSTSEETDAMKKQLADLGGIMSNDAVKASAGFQDSLQNMQTALNGLKNNTLASFLPSLTTVMDGLSSIFSGSDIEGGLSNIEKGVKDLADNLIAKAPQFFQVGGAILNALISSISTNLPTLLQAGLPVIMELGNSIIQNAPSIISAVLSVIGTIGSALGDPQNLNNVIQSAVSIVVTISDSISKNAETVLPAIVDVIMQMLTALTDEKNLMPLLKAGLSVISSLVQGILKAIPVLIKNLPQLISNITKFLVDSTPLIIKAAVELFMGIVKAIPSIIVELAKAIPSIISTLVNGLKDGIKQIASVGSDLIRGLWKGISDMGKWIGEKIKGFGKGVVDGLKKFFKIASPSRLLSDEVGKFLGLGIGEGFEKTMPSVISDMIDSVSAMSDELNDAIALDDISIGIDTSSTKPSAIGLSGANSIPMSVPTTSIGNVTINVYAKEGQDIRELAKAVTEEIQNLISDKEKVYA